MNIKDEWCLNPPGGSAIADVVLVVQAARFVACSAGNLIMLLIGFLSKVNGTLAAR